jgi:peptidyl-prolyl cis-trans isomerase C
MMMLRFGALPRHAAAVLVAGVIAVLLPWASTLAQTPAPAPAAPAAAPADPIVAKVNGDPIYLSDLRASAQSLPQNLQALPPATIYPRLLDRMIDARALAAAARKAKIDQDPAVHRQIAEATDEVLDNALLTKVVMPTITDQALHARYQAEMSGKPGDEEVHAKHILVDSEDQAKQIIAQLNKGADFGALAKQYSKDQGSSGGDLGFFKKDEMVPAFADAAFALKPGQFTQTPVHTQFGWHVIMVVGRRQAPPPSFEQVADQLRQKMLQEGVEKEIAAALATAKVQTFNLDGSPVRATDKATPPPAPQSP